MARVRDQVVMEVANQIARNFGGDFNRARLQVNMFINDTGDHLVNHAVNGGGVNPLIKAMQQQGRIPNVPVDTNARRGMGAFKEGYLGAMDGKTGFVVEAVPNPNQTVTVPNPNPSKPANVYTQGEGQPGVGYAHSFWERPAPEEYDIGEKVLYRAGAVAGDVFGNGTRGKYWQMSPPEVVGRVGARVALGDPNQGFPQAEVGFTPDGGKRYLPGSLEAASIAALTGFASVEAMNYGSGNYDPLNPSEGFRSPGFAAVSADYNGDPTKPTNMAEEVIRRHVFGHKGRLLPWEEFSQERPDVTQGQYEQYKDWKYGRDPNDILRKATFGLASFTQRGISGMPELSMIGTTLNPVGIAAAGLTAFGGRKLNQHLGGRAFNSYQDLQNAAMNGPLTQEQSAEFVGRNARNPFARSVNRDTTGIRYQQYNNRANSTVTP